MSEDIAPQSCEYLQTFGCVCGGGRGGGGMGASLCPTIQTSVTLATLGSCTFITFQQITFKLGNFTNFKTLFSVVSTDFPELVHANS